MLQIASCLPTIGMCPARRQPIALGWKRGVGPKHTRPCHPAPPANEVTADNTQSAAASPATNGPQARHQSQPSVTSAAPATQTEGGCRQAPSKVTVDVAKRHACHTKCRGVTGDQRAPPRKTKLDAATPATQSDGGCRQAPRLQRKVPRRPAKRHKCHTCHAKRVSMSPSATPATQNEGGCRQVPRPPHKVTVHVAKCHACHAKKSRCPMPATQSDGGCRQVRASCV